MNQTEICSQPENSFWISTNDTIVDDGRTRVIIELPSFDKGGMEKVVLDSVLAFKKSKYSILVVTQGSIGYLGTIAAKHNISIMQLPTIGMEYAYGRLIKKFRPHLSMSHFSFSGYPLFQEHGIPNITFIHNVYAFLGLEKKDLFMKSDVAVTHYIAVSKNAADYITKNFFINPEKITIIPNGISISEHENRHKNIVPAKRETFGLKENDYVFLNPASYNLHKGHYLMTDAMTTILKTHNNIKILCVGNPVNSAHLTKLKDHIKHNGLEKHILMPGYVEHIENIMVICDAVLMPSFIEGWSIAMNEAMFYEKPLILTDTGGASEVIKENDIGILLPNEYGKSETLDSKTLDKLSYFPHRYRTSGELVRAMINFAENREFWKKRGALGREKIYQSYSFTSVVNSYECIMDKYSKPNQ
ncbi:MAG: glycosyltransferase family 4 protein [Chlorobium sp.]|nr:MAG: glycosyltransferase family 4 protein [Chlorobium sp.]